MPVIYGQTEREPNTVLTDIGQFAKWFDLNEMDFIIQNIGGRWQCIAWKRERTGEVTPPSEYLITGAVCDSLSVALLRCYEEVRNIQRRLSLIYSEGNGLS